MSMIAKNRTKSTWTPLSNEDTNNKIFEERKLLISKWYEKWSHEQKKQVLEELILKSKLKQKEFIRDFVKENIPALKRDFTRHLPRVLSIYIFSFLDPRSLSRCAQVCWYWKYLTELDQLWMPKCLKLGWTLPFMPSQYEMGVWKRNYLENIKALQIMNPKKHTQLDLSRLHVHSKKPPKDPKQKTAPWRGSDPVPKDTWRFNYLENDDVVDTVKNLRKKKSYSREGAEISHNARSKVKTGQNIHNTQVRKSHSYTKLSTTTHDFISDWEGFRAHTAMTQDPSLDVQRPTPVYSPPLPRSAKHKASARTPRDPPTSDLFPKQPWSVPKQDSDEEL